MLEVVRPAAFSLRRDAQGRVTSFESGGYRSEVSYDDTPGRGQLSASDAQPIWRFKTLAVHGPIVGQDQSAANVGFVVPPSAVTAALPLAAPGGTDGAGWFERAKQLKDLKKWTDEIKRYHDTANRAAQPPSEQAVCDLTDLKHYQDGLEQALKVPNLTANCSGLQTIWCVYAWRWPTRPVRWRATVNRGRIQVRRFPTTRPRMWSSRATPPSSAWACRHGDFKTTDLTE